MFKERYAIYFAAKKLIEVVTHLRDAEDVARRTTEIRNLYVELDEARFFFNATVRAFLNKLHADTELFLTDLSADVNVDDQEAWSSRAERLAHKQAVLRQAYADLPKVFKLRSSFLNLHKQVRKRNPEWDEVKSGVPA